MLQFYFGEYVESDYETVGNVNDAITAKTPTEFEFRLFIYSKMKT